MKSVAKKRVSSKTTVHDKRLLAKARREEVPVSGGISRAAERAGIKRKPAYDDPVTMRRGIVELLVGMLEGAKHAAIEGAIPPRFADAGPEQAIEAYRAIRFVQRDLRRALEGGAV